jgi:hypothetical protein
VQGGYSMKIAKSGLSREQLLTLEQADSFHSSLALMKTHINFVLFTQVFAEPVAMSSFGRFVSSHGPPLAQSIFFFCVEVLSCP